jgi:hypothetical protein
VTFEEETTKVPSEDESYPAPIPAPIVVRPITLEFAITRLPIAELEDPPPIAAEEDDPDVAVTVEFKMMRSPIVDPLPAPTPAP